MKSTALIILILFNLILSSQNTESIRDTVTSVEYAELNREMFDLMEKSLNSIKMNGYIIQEIKINNWAKKIKSKLHGFEIQFCKYKDSRTESITGELISDNEEINDRSFIRLDRPINYPHKLLGNFVIHSCLDEPNEKILKEKSDKIFSNFDKSYPFPDIFNSFIDILDFTVSTEIDLYDEYSFTLMPHIKYSNKFSERDVDFVFYRENSILDIQEKVEIAFELWQVLNLPKDTRQISYIPLFITNFNDSFLDSPFYGLHVTEKTEIKILNYNCLFVEKEGSRGFGSNETVYYYTIYLRLDDYLIYSRPFSGIDHPILEISKENWIKGFEYELQLMEPWIGNKTNNKLIE